MAWKYADELENEYREDLKPLKARYKELKSRKAFLLRYRIECENQKKWDGLPAVTEELSEIKLLMTKIGSIISSSQYSIDWLHNAKEPGNRREIGRRSRYQRTEYWGDIEQVTFNNFREDYEKLSDEELQKLDDYMSTLTEREKHAVVSVIGKGNSYQETADYLGVTRSTAQSYVNRGMKKINILLKEGAQTSLF